MKLSLFASILLVGFTLNAKLPPAGMISPAYSALKKIDAAIDALAKGGGKTGLPTRQAGDVTVHSAAMTQNKTSGADVISIDVGYNICAVTITAHQPPPGIAGAPSYSGKISGCTKYMTALAVTLMKYEDARVSLSAAAGKGISDLAFTVVSTPQGAVVKLNKK